MNTTDQSSEWRDGWRVVLGAAGSGKTLLLKLALGLLTPDTGRIFLFGQDVTNMAEAEWYDVRARVGVLFQEGGLFDSQSVAENVAYPLENQASRFRNGSGPVDPEDLERRVRDSLRFVELEHTLEKFPSVNASIEESEIVYHDFCDISIAVSTPKGLVVPVIRNAESLSLGGGIARRARRACARRFPTGARPAVAAPSMAIPTWKPKHPARSRLPCSSRGMASTPASLPMTPASTTRSPV